MDKITDTSSVGSDRKFRTEDGCSIQVFASCLHSPTDGASTNATNNGAFCARGVLREESSQRTESRSWPLVVGQQQLKAKTELASKWLYIVHLKTAVFLGVPFLRRDDL